MTTQETARELAPRGDRIRRALDHIRNDTTDDFGNR